MRWLGVKRCVQARATPNNTFDSERSKFAFVTVEYQLWSLSRKVDACGQLMHNIVLTIRGTERAGWGGDLFILFNKLFVA